MLILGLYEGQRLTLDVEVGRRVGEVREMIQTLLNITVDNDKHDKKVLVLSWAGSELQDPWVFSDLGIVPGTTIHVVLKEEVKPVLHVRCSHSQETHSVYDNMVIGHMHMDELRSLASRKTGLPIGIFRLVLKNGTEMYDGHRLEDYGIDVGHTVYLETLDGWSEFLNLSVMGFTPQISSDEATGRYQMKVALFVAAHFGHVDLARAMLRQGGRASEPVGSCPQRMWCSLEEGGGHVEIHKAPVHQVVEMGQLGVLRLFVNNDITVVTAKDGDGLRPLNIALRKKVKNCAIFLLTKERSKVNITKSFGLHIGTYQCLRQWCDRAKERAFLKYGLSKSSLKRRPFLTGPLVGFGVCVDGFSASVMNGKSKAQLQKEKEREEKKKRMATRQSRAAETKVTDITSVTQGNDPEAYFRHVLAIQSLKTMGDKVQVGKYGLASRAASKANLSLPSEAATARTHRTPEPSPLPKLHPGGGGGGGRRPTDNPPAADDIGETPRLPPILLSSGQAAKTSRLQRRASFAQSQQSVMTMTSSGVVKAGREFQEQQQQKANSGVGEEERKEGKEAMPHLVNSRGRAYFMTSGGSKQQNATAAAAAASVKAVPSLQLPSTDRSERCGGGGGKATEADNSQTDRSTSRLYFAYPPDSTSTLGDEGLVTQRVTALHAGGRGSILPTGKTDATDVTGGTSTRSLPAVGDRKRKKKKKRVTSALLLSKATANEGAIPLPIISTERDRRPFFYYNGQREDAFVLPMIKNWSKHAATEAGGATPRERAIKSLSVANTFKDKPWLSQVRIALNITTNPTKRTVRRLRAAKKGAFAV
ncbi:hypothetical protein ACOMHN_038303 [Nucella lapillus]